MTTAHEEARAAAMEMREKAAGVVDAAMAGMRALAAKYIRKPERYAEYEFAGDMLGQASDAIRSLPLPAGGGDGWRTDMENAPVETTFLAACPYTHRDHLTGETTDRWDIHTVMLDPNYEPRQLDEDYEHGWDWSAYTHWRPNVPPPAPTKEG